MNGHVRIVRIGPDRFNISDLFERAPAGGGGLDVSVDHFTVAGVSVSVEDRVLRPPRTWRSDAIRLQRHARGRT